MSCWASSETHPPPGKSGLLPIRTLTVNIHARHLEQMICFCIYFGLPSASCIAIYFFLLSWSQRWNYYLCFVPWRFWSKEATSINQIIMWIVHISSILILCLWICTISNRAAHTPDKHFIIHLALVLFASTLMNCTLKRKQAQEIQEISCFFFLSPSSDEVSWWQRHGAYLLQSLTPQRGDPNLKWWLLTSITLHLHLKVC